jgi:hypothetical protein
VGKSRLCEEFLRTNGLPSAYFTSIQGPGQIELERFLATVAASTLPAAADLAGGATARTWESALTLALRGATRSRPSVVVLDELPYLVDKDPSLEATLQLVWDRVISREPVLVIVIGSDRATMEALRTEGRPLYDRARELVVRPLPPSTVGDMLALPPAEALDAYAIIGGFPVLAREWGRGRGLRAYLSEALTDPTSFLVVSAERALAAEFPGDLNARAVLSAVGAGAREHRSLLDRAGLAQVTLDRALQTLMNKGVVDRQQPYSTQVPGRNRQYLVSDPYLRFWLRFVGPELDTIERGRGRVVLERVLGAFATFRGAAIEPIVREAILRQLPDPRFGDARHVGAFWNRTGQIEVDLVGGDRVPAANRIAFVGSIKWREGSAERFRREDVAGLAAHRGEVPGATAETLLVGVSRSGFAPELGLDVQLGPAELLEAYRRRG